MKPVARTSQNIPRDMAEWDKLVRIVNYVSQFGTFRHGAGGEFGAFAVGFHF
ncbi:MAG: hypothetical protein HQL68_12575, partial [Magnetococcales bacterium]|nr:hypothetical protein [Magnetococcales bacterium]